MPRGVMVAGDPRRPINPAMDVLGLERSEKTYIPNEKLVALLYQIKSRIGYRIELYRRLHARAYKKTIKVWNEDTEDYDYQSVPEVLTDEEICERYTVCQNWISIHDSAVKHLNSLKGFGVSSVMKNYHEERRQEERHRESSAGTDNKDKKWE